MWHQRIHGDSVSIHACSNIDVRARPCLFFGKLDTVPARGAFLQHREHERLRAQLIFRISGIACIEYDRKLNSRNGVAPGEMHLDSIGESRGFDGWEIKIRDIADLRQFASVPGREDRTIAV